MSAYMLQETFGILGGNTLLDRLAIASIEVAVLAALLYILCRMRVVRSPRLCALLWLVVLAKPLLSLAIGSPMPVVAIESPVSTTSAVSWGQGNDLDAMIAAQFARDLAQLEQSPRGPITMPMVETPGAAVAQTATPAAEAPATGATSAVAPAREWSLAAMLFVLWIIGVVAMTSVILLDVIKLMLLHRRGAPAPDALHEVADVIARDIGLKRTPKLRVIKGLDSPALVGTLRPTVFMPAWMTEEENADQSAWLLRHELMHARHGDSLALLLRRAAEAIFFFHPVVWFAGRQWEEATELACDRALIADNEQARNYARQLLGVLETRHVQRPMVMSPGLFATRTQIGRRIAALLANPLQHPARLSMAALAIVLVGGVATVSLGLGINKESLVERESTTIETAESEWVAPASRDRLHPDLVRTMESRVRADLRGMHTALASYRVDFNTYPEHKWQLTTPIAYYTSIPSDPFVSFALQPRDPDTGELLPYPGENTLRMVYAPDFTELRVYSIGPDGRDGGGEVTYDPANGVISGGDIVRSIQLEDYYVFSDEGFDAFTGMMEKPSSNMTVMVSNQSGSLRTAAQSIRLWALTNKRMPESWEEMTADDSHVMPPEDTFGEEGAIVKYVLRDGVGTVYSVGPNRTDDGGRRIPNGRYTAASVPDGDIVHTIKWEDIKAEIDRIENPTAAGTEDRFLQSVLKQREETGRDNAMIYYQLAFLTWPGLPAGDVEEEINRLRKADEEWTRDSNKLLPYIKAWEPSFESIRRGVALDFAEQVDPAVYGHEVPVPNFLSAQTSAKALVAQGKYFESQGDYARALNNYITVIRMGRDYGSKNAVLIGSLISIAVQGIGINALGQLVVSGNLTEAQLDHAGKELLRISQTHLGVVEGFRGEEAMMKTHLDNWTKKIGEMSNAEFARERRRIQEDMGMGGLAQFTIRTRQGMINWVESGGDELSQFYDIVIEHLSSAPYEGRFDLQTQFDLAESAKHPMARIAVPNFVEAATRDHVMQTRRGIVQVQIALERYRKFNGRYPEKLTQLEANWIAELPIDSFSGEHFQYHAFDDASKYVLYSLGPDRKDNPEPVAFDPTNGTISAGVIF